MATMTLPATGASTAQARDFTCGATIAQMRVVRRDISTRKIVYALADTLANANVSGITLGGGSINARVLVVRNGRITGLSGLTPGVFYVLSNTVAGDVMPAADLSTGEINCLIGKAVSATELELMIDESTSLVTMP